MKAKLLLITAFLLLQEQFLFSQCISVELTITWEMGYDIFKKDSAMSIPILNITYRNQCDTNYYFFKISPKKDGDLMLQCLALINYNTFDLRERAKGEKKTHAGRYAAVNVGTRYLYYNKGWEMDDFTCGLNDVYKYLYSDRNIYKPTKSNHDNFESSILTPENIISGSVQDQFVFLKPNETHIDTYNLIGYKIVEGCFTFFIELKEIKNYVLTYDGNKTHEFELPAIVGEYLRYSGAFNTNKVTVCFGEK